MEFEFVCKDWGNPFKEIIFKTYADAYDYAKTYEKVSGTPMRINIREKKG